MPQEWEEHEIKRFLDKYTAVTIPVKVTLDAQQQVLDTGSVEKMLSRAEVISLLDCYCRKTLQNCDKPLEVCIGLNKEAEYFIEKEGAKEITLEDALNVLKMSHKAGLVHLAYYRKGEDCDIICSCCSCCCHHLSGLKRFGFNEAVVKSDFVAVFEKSVCSDCGVCVERCQFGAWEFDEGGVEFDVDHCFGCGLCVSSCPTGAVSLVKR